MAQDGVNEEHAAFAARSDTHASPIFFENTNLTLDRVDVPFPHRFRDVIASVEARGFQASQYDVLIIIDLDPAARSGGSAVRDPAFIHVGNYMDWSAPLSGEHWRFVAATAYRHEMAHVWGWDHDWSACEPGKRFLPFITAPVLLGWEDTYGDGIPEIDDPTPYGRAAQR